MKTPLRFLLRSARGKTDILPKKKVREKKGPCVSRKIRACPSVSADSVKKNPRERLGKALSKRNTPLTNGGAANETQKGKEREHNNRGEKKGKNHKR